jgi:hypothetical protein
MLVFFFLFTLLTSPNHFLFSILTSSDFFILFQYFLFGFFLCHAKLFLRYADLRLIIYENLKKKRKWKNVLFTRKVFCFSYVLGKSISTINTPMSIPKNSHYSILEMFLRNQFGENDFYSKISTAFPTSSFKSDN